MPINHNIFYFFSDNFFFFRFYHFFFQFYRYYLVSLFTFLDKFLCLFMYLTSTKRCLLTFSIQFIEREKKSIHTWFLLGAHDTPLDSNTHICHNSFMSLFQKFSELALSFRISLVAQQMPLYIHNHLHISL